MIGKHREDMNIGYGWSHEFIEGGNTVTGNLFGKKIDETDQIKIFQIITKETFTQLSLHPQTQNVNTR
jgi:hypothetical protein